MLIAIWKDKNLLSKFHCKVKSHRKNIGKNVTHGSGGDTSSNMSSLCVYSGPVVNPKRWMFSRFVFRGSQLSHRANYMIDSLSWLGTGDIVLLKQEDIDNLTHVLTPERINRIGIISAPHHGSRNNSDDNLWSKSSLPHGKIASIEAKVDETNPKHCQVEKILNSKNYEVCIASENDPLEWIDEFYVDI